jgi:hypothetical protein
MNRNHFTGMTALLLMFAVIGIPYAVFGADNPDPPSSTVKLIFIHHSTGGNWLADPSDELSGGLGIALRDNNYYVSATNYCWGPVWTEQGEGIGSYTNILHWPEWFTGPNRDTIMTAVYTETGQNFTDCDGGSFGSWSRLSSDPGGENTIVMFKSCFPNSDLYGSPDDEAASSISEWEYTVSNVKAVYNNLLTYFQTRQDKLFVVITAPPMSEKGYQLNDVSTPASERAANARAFNNWLVNDWLDSYPHKNVAVFDYYNVLTSNGGSSSVNDAGQASGNHHRWQNGAVQHIQTVSNNYSSYPSVVTSDWADDHPTSAGHRKATAEFVPLLNVFYHRWKDGTSGTTSTTTTAPPTTTLQSTTTTTTASTTTTTVSGGSTTTTTAGSATTTISATTTVSFPNTKSDLEKAVAAIKISAGMTSSGISISDDVNSDGKIGLPEAISALKGKPITSGDLVQPEDLEYLGAFRLPGGDDKPKTFNYGGNAMTFNPDRDPSDSDGFPGSLFITGHDRQAYGDLPDGDQVAEVSIPVPKKADNPEELPQGEIIQDFYDVAAGYFKELEEIPKVGMQYLNHPDTGPKIHMCWGRHLQMLEDNLASHAWFDPTLSSPNFKGVWFIGNQNPNSVNAYLLDIPTDWADTYTQGRCLGTGRVHGGGLGGLGPALIAYRPWKSDGSAPASGTHLQETPLLLYENAFNTEKIEKCMNGYQHPDLWEGGAWINSPSGKSAVLFAGEKSNGTKYWYGFRHQDGPEYPCPDTHFTDYVTCRTADGSPCPDEDFKLCCEEGVDCISERGWWSTHFDAQLILYNPDDLAKVASGTMESWEPQPYASIDIDEHLYLNPPEWDIANLGAGDQRRFRLGDAAYDSSSGILYVLELYADGAKPVVHVWRIN